MQKSSRRNTIVLLGILSFIFCLVGMFIYSMVATFDRAAVETDARFQECANAPTQDCMMALGIQIALVQDVYPSNMTLVKELAEMGKRQDARAIAVRAEIRKGADPKDARATAMAFVKSIQTLQSGSQPLDKPSLTEQAKAALASRDYHKLITAAHTWHLQGAR